MNYSQIMSPRPPLPRKVGGHDPPAPMGAPLLVSFRMTLSDLEWLSKIFNDTKRRAVSATAELLVYYVRYLHCVRKKRDYVFDDNL